MAYRIISTASVFSTLGEYLAKRMRFEYVIYGWPSYNDSLKMPGLSILNRTDPLFVPTPSQKLSLIDTDENVTDIIYKVGDYTFELQLDMWNRSQDERYEYQARLFEVFHSQDDQAQSALSLEITDWFNQLGNYHLRSINSVSSQDSTERGEFRSICFVTVDCAAIHYKRNQAIIKTPSAELDVSEGPEPLSIGD